MLAVAQSPDQPLAGDAGATTALTEQPDAADQADPVTLSREIYSRIRSGEWLPALAAMLILLVWAVRKFMSSIVKIDFFASKLGGYVLSLSMALALTLGTALQAGQPFGIGLFTMALGAAWAASGGYDTLRDLLRKSK
jgi:hypothetical protein